MHSHAALPETDDLDTRLSLIGVSAPSVLNAPSTETPMPAVVPARRSPPWLALGAGALLLVLTGVVLGARTRARPVVAEAAPNERAAAEPVVAAVVPAAPPVPELPTEPPGYAPVSAEPIPESAAPLPPAAELAPVSSLIAAQPAASGALRLPVQSELVARAPASAGVVEQLPVFDAAAASRAITAAVERSAACRAPTDPGGAVTATLTYAPSGRVTTALISGKFAGTAIGGCIAGRLRGAKVPAFSGDYTTVKRTFVLK